MREPNNIWVKLAKARLAFHEAEVERARLKMEQFRLEVEQFARLASRTPPGTSFDVPAPPPWIDVPQIAPPDIPRVDIPALDISAIEIPQPWAHQ